MKKQKIVLVILLLLAISLMAVACNGKITKENYDKIVCAELNYNTFEYDGGMTIEEVEAILGKPDSSSSSTIYGFTAIAYVWGNSNKNITVSFVNNQAILKVQVGL